MEFGYLKLPHAFSHSKALTFTSNVWTRLGFHPDDKSTWTQNRINMPSHKSEPLQSFAPNVWGAICELLGGEERVDPVNARWNDGLIVNLGTKEMETEETPDPRELNNWHVDGDFFRHFLDSPEQALVSNMSERERTACMIHISLPPWIFYYTHWEFYRLSKY